MWHSELSAFSALPCVLFVCLHTSGWLLGLGAAGIEDSQDRDAADAVAALAVL